MDTITSSRRDFLKVSGLSLLATLVPFTKTSEVTASEISNVIHGQKIPTICTFCAVGCGIITTVGGGKVFDTEGDPYHPINQGTLCPKGRASEQLINNPLRLAYPMMRTNPKKGIEEDPGWRTITWDEAFNVIGDWTRGAVEEEVERLRKNGIMQKKTSWDEEKYYFDGHDFPISCLGSAVYNNEEAYLNRKLWTIMGSNNIDHCARRCHSSTVVALGNTFGFGAMTNHFNDMQWANVIIHQGGNPASAHPVAYRWLGKAKSRGAKVIVLDPRFSRSATQADIYGRVRVGTDPAVFLGITKYAIDKSLEDKAFLNANTNSPFVLDTTKYPYSFVMVESESPVDFVGNQNLWRGLMVPAVKKAGVEALQPWCEVQPDDRELDWSSKAGKKTVFNVLYHDVLSNYTPEEVSRITGLSVEKFLEVAETFAKLSAEGRDLSPPRAGTVTYAMGLTQHTCGVQLLRALTIMQLTLGNMGKRGGGVNAIRGQNNVQGATDMLVLCHNLPGYVPVPTSETEIREEQFWKNLNMPSDVAEKCKIIRDTSVPKDYKLERESLLKKDSILNAGSFISIGSSGGGLETIAGNELTSDLVLVADCTLGEDSTIKAGSLVKKDSQLANPWYMNTLTRRTYALWALYQRVWGIFVGTFPLGDPYKGAIISDLPFNVGHFTIDMQRAFGHGKTKVEFIMGENSVVTDGSASETYEELRNGPGKLIVGDIWRETETSQLADIVLPMATVYERDGSVSNSGRWIQWRWKVSDPPGDAKSDLWAFINLYKTLRQRRALELPSERYIEDHKGIVDPETGKALGEQGWLENIEGKELWGPRPCPDKNWNWYADADRENAKAAEQVYAEIDDAVFLYKGQYRNRHLTDPEAKVWAIKALDKGMGENLSKRRIFSLRSGLDEEWTMYKNWTWCWPNNIRVLYNKEDLGESDSLGTVWTPKSKYNYYSIGSSFWIWKDRSGLGRIWAQGLASSADALVNNYDEKWGAESKPPVPGEKFRGKRLKGPEGRPIIGIPEHFEPMESPNTELAADYPCYGWLYVGKTDHEGNDKLWKWGRVGTPEEYDVILGTFRLTEHFHSWTRNLTYLNEGQPENFVEICKEHAENLGIKSGNYVAVESKRGRILVKARVTERVGKLNINGKEYFEIAMPFHHGFKGLAKGSITNFVTIGAVDTHSKIPETKACLCKVEKPKPEELMEVLEKGYFNEGKV
ncbi:MAG: molybdopterin-dependent oxidoreductase [Candidatus Bathyarchaeota archaeon]|nr:molybdopterin-dependent oxidoreductase [Candidatus Bathyarchaeota archaeon]